MFYWHLVSLFAPENLLFLDAVKDFDNARNKSARKKKLDYILDVFFGESSFYEIHKNKLKKEDLLKLSNDELKPGLFSNISKVVEQDLSRGLTVFWSSDLFKLFLRHKKDLGPVLESNLFSESQCVVAGEQSVSGAEIRQRYGEKESLLLLANCEVGSRFTYVVTNAKRKQIGWCRLTGDFFVFCDMDEKELCELEVGALLGNNSNKREVKEEKDDNDDDEFAASGCFGKRSNRKISRSQSTGNLRTRSRSLSRNHSGSLVGKDLREWYLRASLDGPESLPLSMKELQLLYRFHVIEETFLVRSNNMKWVQVRDAPELFNPNKQLQLFDPTSFSQGTIRF